MYLLKCCCESVTQVTQSDVRPAREETRGKEGDWGESWKTHRQELLLNSCFLFFSHFSNRVYRVCACVSVCVCVCVWCSGVFGNYSSGICPGDQNVSSFILGNAGDIECENPSVYSIDDYASCVKAAFSLLTTKGRLLWLYRSLCFKC